MATVIAAAGLWFTGVQLHDSHKEESARFALQFDDRMKKPELVAIIDDAYSIPPIKMLTEHGGQTTDDQLEELLGDYDTLYYLYQDHLISDKLLNDVFCNDLQAVNANAEVRDYLKDDRQGPKGNADDWIGLDQLGAICSRWDKSGRGHALAR